MLIPPTPPGFFKRLCDTLDDIDAFLRNGSERSRVYATLGDGNDVLPDAQSVDFRVDEM